MPHAYGLIRDPLDARDHRATTPRAVLPKLVDLRPGFPGVYDQGNLGSCTANAACALYAYTSEEQGQHISRPSRLYQYYNSRLIEGTVGYDAGATIRGSFKALNQYGICLEATWPYRVTRYKEEPPAKCYNFGKNTRVFEYQRVDQTEAAIKGQLAAGNPISFGFQVAASFESDELARTGVYRMPSLNEVMNGGHCMLLVGYDSYAKVYIARNSWGPNWGIGGYCMLPEALIHSVDWTWDLWTLLAVAA